MRSTCLCLIHALADRRTMASTNYLELWWAHRFYSTIVGHQVISSYSPNWSEGIERESSWRESRWWSSVHVDLETLRGTDRIVCVDCAWMRWKMKFGWFRVVISYIERKMILIYRMILLIYILQWRWSFFLSFFISSRYLLYFIGYIVMKWNLFSHWLVEI